MQYVGGKQKSGGHRIAEHVLALARRVGASEIVEPFCGGLSVTYRLKGFPVRASDACESLITLYQAVQQGWEPPATVDRATWETYKADPVSADPMTAFVGFGCSRSGAWFSAFVSDYKYTKRRVPAATAARDSLKKKIAACEDTTFTASDYRNAPVHGIWYCDIPYVDTLGYPAVGPFDHATFWAFASEVSEHVPVVVSEREAPPSFTLLDEWSVQRRLNTPAATRRVERLFIHERWACQ